MAREIEKADLVIPHDSQSPAIVRYVVRDVGAPEEKVKGTQEIAVGASTRSSLAKLVEDELRRTRVLR